MADVFRSTAGSLGYPVALQLVTDEEVGGFDGTAHQIANGVRGEFVILGEHSGLRVVTESKGISRVWAKSTLFASSAIETYRIFRMAYFPFGCRRSFCTRHNWISET